MEDKDLFPKACAVGLGQIRSWLPDGRQEGKEWVALNPLRGDGGKHSFSVNLNTGIFCDFAYPEYSGHDAVALYALLNESSLSEKARKFKGDYKRALQTVAAQEILLMHDDLYFPKDSDCFVIPEQSKKGDYWEGWREVPAGIAETTKLDTTWYAKNWGEHLNSWDFNVSGKTVMKVCRFLSEAKTDNKKRKKNDRPFTLWTNGKEYKWRAKTPSGLYPLWNADELEAYPNKKVLLHEGQKAASVVEKTLGAYISIGCFGGSGAIEKQNWGPLRGREVWYCFDADEPGRASIHKIRSVAEKFDIDLHIVYPPTGVDKGWDLADAIEDDWTVKQLTDHIEKKKEAKQQFIDDGGAFKFEILGYSGDDIIFFPHGKKSISKFKASGLTKGALLTLQDRDVFGDFFAKPDGGIAWDTIVNTVIREAEEKPIFNYSRIRGTGVWKDSGKMVINDGQNLIIDGSKKELYETPGEFIYNKGKYIPYCTESRLSEGDAGQLMDILKLIDWKQDIYADIIAGWMTIAPFGGALNWKPYVWLIGPLGSGKTYVMDKIVNKIVSHEFGIFGLGTSTPAGVRDALANNSIAAIMDEMESDNIKLAETIDANLRMFREGSSTSEAVTFHGTQDGVGREWRVQSIALFASIGANIRHGADRSRFTEIVLSNPYNTDIVKREANFKKLEKGVEVITPTWSRAYHSRTYEIFHELEKCITVMSNQVSEIMGSRRQGDQLGTLLAGGWMSSHDTAISAAEAKAYLATADIKTIFGETKGKTDEELILDEILTSRVELSSSSGNIRVTIGAALAYWYSVNSEKQDLDAFTIDSTVDVVKKELEQFGIKPQTTRSGSVIQVAVAHPAIRKMLKDTPWASMYDAMLGRLSFCDDKLHGPSKFAGVSKRYRELDAREVLDPVLF